MDATDTIFILLLSYSLFIATTEGTGSVSFTKYKIEMSNMDQAQLPIDLDAMPSHITGTAILHASDGSLVRPCSGKMTEEDARVLYLMLAETGTILENSNEKVKRVTIGLNSISYAVTIATDGFVYAIQTEA